MRTKGEIQKILSDFRARWTEQFGSEPDPNIITSAASDAIEARRQLELDVIRGLPTCDLKAVIDELTVPTFSAAVPQPATFSGYTDKKRRK